MNGIVELIVSVAVVVGVSLAVTVIFAYFLRALVALIDQVAGVVRRNRPTLSASWEAFSFRQ